MLKSKPAAVNLKRKIKHNGVWTFVPVAKKNGHYVADRVMIDGVPTKVDDGTYYIEWREDGKRIQKSVGQNGRGGDLRPEELRATFTRCAARG